VPELMEEDHEAQNEQEGDDVSNNATAKRMQMRENIGPHDAECPAQMMVPARFRRYDAIAAISGKR
jgi:hypothetical protein